MAEIDDAVALYRASQYSGSGDWLDESGNGYDMAATGSPTFTDLGNDSYWTTGTGKYFTTADVADLDILAATDFTVVAIAQADTIAFSGLVTKRANVNDTTTGWSLWTFTNDAFIADFSDGAVECNADTGASSFNVDERHLFAFRRNTSDDKGYANVDTTEAEDADPTTGTCANSGVVSIGAFNGGANLWFGRIYGVAIWRRALTDAQLLVVEAELVPALPTGGMLLLGVG